MAETFQLELTEAHMLAPTVRHVTMVRTDGEPLAFTPGQFLQLHFNAPDGTAVKRSFSVATPRAAEEPSVTSIDLTVSYVEGGAATALFRHMQIGDKVEATGPYGRFCFMDGDANQRYILVATGTGIAAYRAMREQIAHLMETRGVDIVLLHGARYREELLYGKEFVAFAQRHPQFTYLPCYSRALPADAAAYERRGYVQAAFAEIKPDPETDIAYLCGNPDMVDDAFAALKEYGLRVRYIRREKYTYSR